IKLLDFGIAKVLGDGEESPGPRTGTLGRMMTPEYASPEQKSGASVTTASDGYQLGILLYELLTGRRPLEEAGSTPRRPSTVVLAPASITHRSGASETIEPETISARRG